MTRRFSAVFLLHRLCDILLYYGFEYVELQSALVLILRGLWIINPLVDNVRLYTVINGPLIRLFPPVIWSLVFIVAGLYELWALLIDELPHRRRATQAAFMLWLFVGFISIGSFFSTTSVPLFFLFAVQNGWGFVRMRMR